MINLLVLAVLLMMQSSATEVPRVGFDYQMAISHDEKLQEQARKSPHYDGKLLMELVNMMPAISKTSLEDYYNMDEVAMRAEDHLYFTFTTKCHRFICTMGECQNGGTCMYKEAFDVLTEEEFNGLTEKWEENLPDNIASKFRFDSELFATVKQTIIDKFWTNKTPGWNRHITSGELPEVVSDAISFPDDPVKQSQVNNIVEILRKIAWKHMIDIILAVLNDVAQAANDRERVTEIASTYVVCECILGFTGEFCDVCPIQETFMKKLSQSSPPIFEYRLSSVNAGLSVE